MQLADDLSFSLQQGHSLGLKHNRVFEHLLEGGDLFRGNLLQIFFLSTIVEVILLEEETCEVLL